MVGFISSHKVTIIYIFSLSRKLFESRLYKLYHFHMSENDINSISEEVHQIYIEIKKQEQKLKYLKKKIKRIA